MLEQIKNLCLFMICGQTLLYFQSGKKYEKICRMILELLILAGIVGMILNFLQSLGFRKGEMEAAGSAVAGMQRRMEEALEKQLEMEGFSENIFEDDMLDTMLEKYTVNEIKSRYNYFANQYGYEIQMIKRENNKLQVFLNEVGGEEGNSTENSAKIAEIEKIEKIEIGEIVSDGEDEGGGQEKKSGSEQQEREIYFGGGERKKEELETFRRQLALVLSMEEKNLEVILIDR